MTGKQVRKARTTLGKMWGLDRPLHMAELGELLRLKGRDPGATIREWEREKTLITGPASVAIEMMLAGAEPPTKDAVRSHQSLSG